MRLLLSTVHRSASLVAGRVRPTRVTSWLQMALVHGCSQADTWLCTTPRLVIDVIQLLAPFVVSGAQMDHCWGHLRVSVTDVYLAGHFVAPVTEYLDPVILDPLEIF